MAQHIYVPDPTDTELAPKAKKSLAEPWGMIDHYGGQNTLGQVADGDTLFIMVHGSSEMPLLTCRKCVVDNKVGQRRYWSAAQMAALLKSDGLPLTHRDLNMLVCHAGESVGDLSIVKQRLAIQERVPAARNNAVEMKRLTKLYADLAPLTATSHFTNYGQTFPMGAQLFRELFLLGYNNLRITSYKAPVAQYFGMPSIGQKDFEVNLVVPGIHDPVEMSKCPHLVTVITKALFKRFGWKLSQAEKPQMLSCW